MKLSVSTSAALLIAGSMFLQSAHAQSAPENTRTMPINAADTEIVHLSRLWSSTKCQPGMAPERRAQA